MFPNEFSGHESTPTRQHEADCSELSVVVGIPQSDFGCASRGSSAHSRGSMDSYVDNEFLLAEILDAEISILVKTVFGLKTDVTARELAGVI